MAKKRGPVRHKVVLVRWGDAFIDTDDFKEDEAKDTEPVWRYTVGLLISKNQHGLVLATDEYEIEKDGVAGRMFIPKSMTNKVWELGIL